MDSIVGTLSTLTQQAGLMGREIVEHNEQIFRVIYINTVTDDCIFKTSDGLERGVGLTDSKLSDAMQKMRKFLRDSGTREQVVYCYSNNYSHLIPRIYVLNGQIGYGYRTNALTILTRPCYNLP
jgi:hypothetical protein